MKLRDWYRLTNKADSDVAELSIFDVIGGGFFADEDAPTGKRVAAQLDALPDAVKTIKVYVNSPGGAISDALHIANALRRQSTEKNRTVEITVEGIAASAATLVTSAGDVIKIPRNAVMMIHPPSAVAMGTAASMRSAAELLDRVTDSIVATYRWVSNKSADELRALMAKTTWMNAEEALSNGFATEIIGAVEATASVDLAEQLETFGAIPEPFRARVEALTKKPAPAPKPDIAEPAAIIRACKAAGFPELAEDLLNQPMAAVETALKARTDAKAAADARATEIRALCGANNLPKLADRFVATALPVADVKALLLVVTATLAGEEIDSALDPTKNDPPAPAKAANVFDLYTAREQARLASRRA